MASWQIIVLEGQDERIRGFAAGFLAGAGMSSDAMLYGPDLPLHPEPLGERLRAALRGRRHVTLFVREPEAEQVAAAMASAPATLGLRVLERATLVSASLAFNADTPSRDAAAKIHAALEALPAGVALVDVEREELDPTARGVELYAPVHAYRYRAHGRVVGDLAAVVRAHATLAALDFVTVEPITLEERALDPRT
jgi:hypothetical protein